MKTRYQYVAMPATTRVLILLRDDYTCQDCGIRGESGRGPGQVQVHHITPYRLCGSHDSENLIVVCSACHRHRDRPYWLASMREWQSRLGWRMTPMNE